MDDTEQLRIWKGSFGEAYNERVSVSDERLRPRLGLWSRILNEMRGAPLQSVLEVGANVGLNLVAIDTLCDTLMYALEPNTSAREAIVRNGILPEGRVFDGTAAEIAMPDASVDLVFTYAVLLHIAPDDLLESCKEIHRVAKKYVLSIEYFSRNPETQEYRGHANFLFKRDYGSFWLENFPDLEPVDCGFAWKPLTGVDDVTWWLFRKR